MKKNKLSLLDVAATSGYDGSLEESATLQLSEQHCGGNPHIVSVAEERACQWGDTYKVIGPLAKGVLGIEMNQQQFCAFMVLLKLVRYHKSGYTEKDCMVDIANYARLALE